MSRAAVLPVCLNLDGILGNITGSILAPPLVAFLALKFGWQWSFMVT